MFLIIKNETSGNIYLVMGRWNSMARVLKSVFIKNEDAAMNLKKKIIIGLLLMM